MCRMLLLLLFVLAAWIGAMSAAQAAPLLSVSYTIQAGSTASGAGGNTVAIVPGGTITFTPATPLPYSGICTGGCGVLALPSISFTSPLTGTNITATGGYLFFSAINLNINSAIASSTFTSALQIHWPYQLFSLLPTTFAFVANSASLENGGTISISTLASQAPFAGVNYVLGNEIKTFVPEPGNSLLLGVGLPALLLLDRLRRRRRVTRA